MENEDTEYKSGDHNTFIEYVFTENPKPKNDQLSAGLKGVVSTTVGIAAGLISGQISSDE